MATGIKTYMKAYKNKLKAFFSFLEAIFTDKGIYRYSWKDLWQGAWVLRNGYADKVIKECTESDGRYLLVNINGQVIKVVGGVFKEGELAWIYQETFGTHSYNPHAYIKGSVFINADDVVIDAGACEGFFSKLALNCGCARVYAFEPVKSLQQGLLKTFENDRRVNVVPFGVADVEVRTKISLGSQYVCEAKLAKDGAHEIGLTTLDAFVKSEGLSRIDFIKMDIEGAEFQAIQGARQVLQRFVPKLSIAVYHEYEMADRLRKLILEINPDYTVEYGGCYMYEKPFRPFMLYAYRSEK